VKAAAKASQKTPETTPGGVAEMPFRLAIIGIGNELNGDDAAGVLIARRLAVSLSSLAHILVVDGGPAPENFTGPLRRFKPHLALIVDAANMGAQPGDIAMVNWQDLDGLSASTHSLPPSVFGQYLMSETGCELALLAVQAAQLEHGAPLTPAVAAAVESISQAIEDTLLTG